MPAMEKLSTPLHRAIAILGGDKAFCSALGISLQRLAYWLKKEAPPPEFCPTIERLTKGLVTCEQLAPKVEWAVLRMQVEA